LDGTKQLTNLQLFSKKYMKVTYKYLSKIEEKIIWRLKTDLKELHLISKEKLYKLEDYGHNRGKKATETYYLAL